MAYGSVLGRNTKPQFVPTFAISGPFPGDTVTVSYGGTTVEAVEDNGVWYAKAWAYGSYTVSVGSKSTTVNVDEVKLYEVVLKSSLNDSSWNAIRKVADAGQASNYWEVGDTKTVVLNGTVQGYTFNNLAISAFIIGIEHNSDKEGANKIHFQIGKINSTAVALCDGSYNNSGTSVGFRMNASNTNSGGWNASYMRKTVLGNSGTPTRPLRNSLMAALPTDLRAVMKSVIKYTDNTGNASSTSDAITATTDFMFLLAEFEVQGNRTRANSYEQNYQTQYDYYKAGNSKIKYRYNNAIGLVAIYWNRSAAYLYSSDFCCVDTGGNAGLTNADRSLGLAPAFCV